MPPETGRAAITRIAVHLPPGRLTNADLAREHPDWEVDRVAAKTGVFSRAVAPADRTAADLGVAAAEALFALDADARSRVDHLIFCTQTPDYFLPGPASMAQHRLGLPTSVGAVDVNLGCSGHVYGLSLAKGLVETGQARSVLLVTAETYTHIIHPDDRSVRSLFGDGAAATLVEPASPGGMDAFVFGSDGGGAKDLILRGGAFRARAGAEVEGGDFLQMNGQAVFNFTSQVIPKVVRATLEKADAGVDDIDLFVFHQASQLVVEALRRSLRIPADKCWFGIGEIGNTVSSTIPIALAQAAAAGRLSAGDKVLVAGFGVGLSWAAAVLTWGEDVVCGGAP